VRWGTSAVWFGDIEEAGLNRPLETLLTALLDLELGTLPKLLEPRRTVGQPPMSYARQMLTYFAAFVLDELMDLGMRREAGAQAVAKEIGQAGIFLPGEQKKSVTARLVISWRDRLNAGPGAMDFIVEIWRRRPESQAIRAWLSARFAGCLTCRPDRAPALPAENRSLGREPGNLSDPPYYLCIRPG
jgi:hypothetical protein